MSSVQDVVVVKWPFVRFVMTGDESSSASVAANRSLRYRKMGRRSLEKLTRRNIAKYVI